MPPIRSALALLALLALSHYLDLAVSGKSQSTDSSVAAGRAAFLDFIKKGGVSKEAASQWLETPMLAVSNAEPVCGGYAESKDRSQVATTHRAAFVYEQRHFESLVRPEYFRPVGH